AQGQASALLADRLNTSAFYISGDEDANAYGNAYRVVCNDANPSLDSWTQVVEGGPNGTAPHADSRDMVYEGDSDVGDCGDGGIYRLVTPNSSGKFWESVIGDLGVTELYSVSYDSRFNIIFAGAQDTGQPSQTAPDSFIWQDKTGGDGGEAEVDPYSLA